MVGYIYKTTCIVENKIYVGKHEATEFEGMKYLGSGIWLKRAIKKFGKENFICEMVDTADTLEELWAKEEYWVEELHARDPAIGYNLMSGGKGGSKGLITIFKGDQCKKVSKEVLNEWILDGWFAVGSDEWKQMWKNKWALHTTQQWNRVLADPVRHAERTAKQKISYKKRMLDSEIKAKELARGKVKYQKLKQDPVWYANYLEKAKLAAKKYREKRKKNN